MNAVKRCQALIAATLLIGACGGDPTSSIAGKDLSIRATPGAVWVRNNSVATVNIEAVDKLGGPVAGTWTVGTIVGPFTVVVDTTFQNTSVGQLGDAARFVVTPTAEGDGSVNFTGTGGTINVPIRIAPDTIAFNVVFIQPTQTGDSVIVPLNDSVTIATTAGIRFTSGTTVSISTGPLARDTALFIPIRFSIAADSTHLTFTPGPDAFRPGASTSHVRVTGIASNSTPGLTSTARTLARLVVPQFDTAGSTLLVLSTTTPVIGQNITVTLPPEYRFSPNTTVNQFTTTPGPSGPVQVQTDGLAVPGIVSISADSGTLVYLPAPGATGQPWFTNIRVRNNAAAFALNARASGSYTVPSILNVAATQPATALEDSAVTITMPVGTKFRPTSTIQTAGGPPLDAIVVSRAADSSSVTVIPAPGFFKPFNLTALKDTRVPTLTLSLPTRDTTKTTAAAVAPNAVQNLGPDDPMTQTIPTINAPNALNGVTGFWDLASTTAPDYTPDGATRAQYFRIHATRTGNVLFSLDWGQGTKSNTDLDFILVIDDGNFDTAVGNVFSGAASNKPENATYALVSGTNYVLAVIDYGPLDGFGALAATTAIKVTMTGK